MAALENAVDAITDPPILMLNQDVLHPILSLSILCPCSFTKSIVQQINTLRSTCRTFRDFVSNDPDSLVVVRCSTRDHTLFKFVKNHTAKLKRTISVELIQELLFPYHLKAIIDLIPSTPNIHRLAIHGRLDTWYWSESVDLLRQLCCTITQTNFPHLQSIVLDCHCDLTDSIRGKMDIATMRFHWVRTLFPLATPMTWDFLRNLCIDVAELGGWPWPNDGPGVLEVLTKDTLRNLKKLELRMHGQVPRGMALVRSVSDRIEELFLFMTGDQEEERLPDFPKLRVLGCYPRSWTLLQGTQQRELQLIEVQGVHVPFAYPHLQIWESRDAFLVANIPASSALIDFLRQQPTNVFPRLKKVWVRFLTNVKMDRVRAVKELRDEVVKWKGAASGGETGSGNGKCVFQVHVGSGQVLGDVM
ncbi:hypothetical protein SCHPADRAFT_941603 [Schizopora paradoxa]|uniref:Uncharacterized protein n=1 Tax=Schizopora paradoxa TaxID=27342 RepID=A0A0H2RJD6_9AGAM|nr:hypothetical protein SCHPADRAFT_941603 [Schizopora paradoxa]